MKMFLTLLLAIFGIIGSYLTGEGCLMPPTPPLSMQALGMNQSEWNRIRAKQLRQVTTNRGCLRHYGSSPFVCELKVQVVKQREGVCLPGMELPMCLCKNETSPFGKSSLGYDRQNCGRVSGTRRSAMTYRYHQVANAYEAETLYQTQGQRHLDDDNNDGIRCYFNETITEYYDGTCIRFDKFSRLQLPAYGCLRRKPFHVQFLHKDCSFFEDM